jgi:hypothetical protein
MEPLTLTRPIDPQGLPEPVLAGERCAYPNCRRSLPGRKTLLGQTPDGTPVFVCNDHEEVSSWAS